LKSFQSQNMSSHCVKKSNIANFKLFTAQWLCHHKQNSEWTS